MTDEHKAAVENPPEPQKAVPVPELEMLAKTILSGVRELKRTETDGEHRIEETHAGVARRALSTVERLGIAALAVAGFAVYRGQGDLANTLVTLLVGLVGGVGLGSFFARRAKDES